MMPQPMVIFLVSRATIAVTAVEDRASMECLRHHGYASASQNVSNPAASQACAMRIVSSSGSILSCNTPILKGMLIGSIFSVDGFAAECGRLPRLDHSRNAPNLLRAARVRD